MQLPEYQSVTILFVNFSYSPTVVQEILDERDSPSVKYLEAVRNCSYTMMKHNLFANTRIILAIYLLAWYENVRSESQVDSYIFRQRWNENMKIILIQLIYFRLLVNLVFVQFPQSIFRRNALCANGTIDGVLTYLDNTTVTSKVNDDILLYLNNLFGYFRSTCLF